MERKAFSEKLKQLILRQGVSAEMPKPAQRTILASNYISLILAGFNYFVAGIYYFLNMPVVGLAVSANATLYFLPIILNANWRFLSSRVLLSCLLSITTTAVSVIAKYFYPETIATSNYFGVRFFLVIAVVIPILIFRREERKILFSILIVDLLCVILFDSIHNLFGTGYHQFGFTDSSYPFTSLFFPIISQLFIIASTLWIKDLTDKADNTNESLIEELRARNVELDLKNKAISDQSEELKVNQEHLIETYKIIEQQRLGLEGKNITLEKSLINKIKELYQSKELLVKYNNELQEFSYALSHNLRAPVARLLGLSKLIKLQKDLKFRPQERLLLKFMSESAVESDEVLRDINKILHIRNDAYQIREQINLKEIIEQVKNELSDRWSYVHEFKTVLNIEEVYALRPMVHSILFHLLSNAIKFRKGNVPLVVELRTMHSGDYVLLEVEDNGLGLNVKAHRENIFKMYKRFHPHIEGKGFGLFLIKTQAEAMSGHVDVKSVISEGSVFQVWIKKLQAEENQIVFNHPKATIFYNAYHHVTGIEWKEPAFANEARVLYHKALSTLKLYHTTRWISNIKYQGFISTDNEEWFFKVIITASKLGLREVAIVHDGDPLIMGQIAQLIQNTRKINIPIEWSFYRTMPEALAGAPNESLS